MSGGAVAVLFFFYPAASLLAHASSDFVVCFLSWHLLTVGGVEYSF